MAKSKKIFLVEDNRDIADVMDLMLTGSGYEVEQVKNPVKLPVAAKKSKPDLIIMDMLLSGADGCNICRRIRKFSGTENIPVLMISAHPNAKATTLKAGADYFLAKPFDIDDILDIVKKLTEHNGKLNHRILLKN